MNEYFKVSSEAFQADMKALARSADLETVTGLKGVAKVLVRAERAKAPVYGGKGVTRKQFKMIGPLPSTAGSRNGPIVGLLRASVKSGRVKKDGAGDSGMNYRVVVGPGGGRTNLYKAKIERIYHFAEQSYNEVVPFANVIMAAAWAKALRRAA